MTLPPQVRKPLAALLLLLITFCAQAHPIPDIPVRGFFERGGDARIEIEIDPRFFAEDPLSAPYLFKKDFDALSESEKAAMIEDAKKVAARSVAFHFQPMGEFVPAFQYRFTGLADSVLEKEDQPVMVTGIWTTQLTTGLTGYRVDARPTAGVSVVVLNSIDGRQLERVHVLFPGEQGYLLDLTGLQSGEPAVADPEAVGATGGAGATFVSFLRQGFLHVLPLGLDHILFVLGLFLLSREWRPLLWQVTMFTLAHTLTLGLATLGGFSVSASIVEPVIAASIVVVALENIFHDKYTPWRLGIVFAFGLVHGLGFAGALQDLALPATSLLVGLLGFNVGVEFGQLTIVAIALAATFWVKPGKAFRKYLAIPGSLVIALAGAWWTVERILVR